MSFTHETVLWCDLCSNWERVNTRFVRKTRRQLKSQGWKHSKGKDYCPQCVERGYCPICASRRNV